jgi:FlaA1/EpsC-like NDP-sugar epimerase
MFFLVDTVLLLGSATIGYYLRLGWKEYPLLVRHLLNRGLFFTFVFQTSLYYFELYDLKIVRDRSKFGRRFVQSIAAALATLMITYYMLPFLYLGRGVLLYTVILAVAAVFFWRILYRSIVKSSQLNERIIILGTGEFAKEIAREIRDKGDSGFEVLGYIDEQKESKK